MQEPDIILADEPIASLDPRNTKIVMDSLLRLNKHFGITVICNLHDLDIAKDYCDRLVGMAQGRVVFDGAPEALTEDVARDLYGLEAGEAMNVIPAPQLITGRGRCPSRPDFPHPFNRREKMSISRRLMLGLAAGAAMLARPPSRKTGRAVIPNSSMPSCPPRTPLA